MRYPQGGGLTPERQAFRERIRMEAAERFAAGATNGEVAKELRVIVRITVHYLPAYTLQLNPVEGIWSLLRRRCQASTDFTNPAHLMRALRRILRQVQYRPEIIDGCLAGPASP